MGTVIRLTPTRAELLRLLRIRPALEVEDRRVRSFIRQAERYLRRLTRRLDQLGVQRDAAAHVVMVHGEPVQGFIGSSELELYRGPYRVVAHCAGHVWNVRFIRDPCREESDVHTYALRRDVLRVAVKWIRDGLLPTCKRCAP